MNKVAGTHTYTHSYSYDCVSSSNLCICVGTYSAEQPPTIKISKYDHDLHEGASVNITATIQSGPPLVSLKWEAVGADLPPNTKNYTYSDGVAVYSILELRSLCYSDSGNYTITATNEYGTSVGSAPLQISKGMSQLHVSNVNSFFVP